MTTARIAAIALAAVFMAAPALAQTPDPQQIAAARSMMDRSGASKGFEMVVPNFLEESKRLFLQTRPELAADLDKVAMAMAPEFTKRKEEILNDFALAYARRFTKDELIQIDNFYKSSAGKKFVELLPGVMEEGREKSLAWSRKLSEDIVTRMRAEMKKLGHDI
jgi:hypothetical protein